MPPVISPAKGKEPPKVDQAADMETDDGGGDMEMEEDEPAQEPPAQVRWRRCCMVVLHPLHLHGSYRTARSDSVSSFTPTCLANKSVNCLLFTQHCSFRPNVAASAASLRFARP